VGKTTSSWGQTLLDILNVHVNVIGKPAEQPQIMVGNHVSYLDIPLLMSRTPTVFIAKRELAKWPVFGPGMAAAGTVFVDRSSAHSRRGVLDAIGPAVTKDKKCITIFPSGTTTLREETAWRWGVFLIAKRQNIPVQPFRISYRPLRAIAYIDDDTFFPHLWRLLGQERLEAEIEFHDPVEIKDPETDAAQWNRWASETKAQRG